MRVRYLTHKYLVRKCMSRYLSRLLVWEMMHSPLTHTTPSSSTRWTVNLQFLKTKICNDLKTHSKQKVSRWICNLVIASACVLRTFGLVPTFHGLKLAGHHFLFSAQMRNDVRFRMRKQHGSSMLIPPGSSMLDRPRSSTRKRETTGIKAYKWNVTHVRKIFVSNWKKPYYICKCQKHLFCRS